MMESNVRYLWNWGLAFDEARLLKRLEDLAGKGWILDSISALRYRLRKGEPQALRYSMDYRKLKAGDEMEYLTVFAEAGWERVCSLQGIYFFCAAQDAVAIHTDQATKKEKYSGYKRGSFLAMVISALLFVVLFGLEQMNAFAFLGRSQNLVFPFLLAGTGAVFIPSCMMSMAYAKRMREIESEER